MRTRNEANEKLMKAVRVHRSGGPEVLQLDTNVPVPRLGSNEVLLRVKAVGINPLETYIREKARKPGEFPFILGSDCAGIVEEVGSEVKGCKEGDRVFTALKTRSGCYAEHAVACSTYVYHLPHVLSFQQGAALGIPYFTAYRALFQKANARPGETVLVHGASGGVGIAAVQFARANGMRVIGTAGTDEGIEIVKKAGAHYVFNHRSPGYLEGVKEAAGESGVDVVIENAAHVNLGNDLTLLALGGRVTVIGCRGAIEINPRDTMARETSICRIMILHAINKDLKEAEAAIQAGAECGWLRPIVGKEYLLEQASAAHEEFITRRGALGKVVLTVS